jgi:hypothetical protein
MGDVSQERFQTGNHCRVYFTGNDAKLLLGEGGNFSGALNKGQNSNVSQSTGARPVHVVGDPEPQEIVDTQHTYTVRIDTLRLRADNAAQMMKAGPVDIEMVDRFNAGMIAVAKGCKLADSNLSIPANQLVVRNVTFQSMGVSGG